MNGKRLVAAFTVLLLYLLSSMEVSGRDYTFQRLPSGNVTLEFQMPHHNYIKSACVAPDGRVWMATTMGVGRLDNKDKSFKHHGRIGARNSENRGATFFFELPLNA